MKYDCIEIRPSPDYQAWRVSLSQDDEDRFNTPTQPNSLGFYHYPRRKGTAHGFNTLKAHLIARHREEINRLQRSLDALYKLTNPYENK